MRMIVATGYTAWSMNACLDRALHCKQQADAFATLYSRRRAIASAKPALLEGVRFCD